MTISSPSSCCVQNRLEDVKGRGRAIYQGDILIIQVGQDGCLDRTGNSRGNLTPWMHLEEKLLGIADTLYVGNERKRTRRGMGLWPEQLNGWAHGR